MKMDDIAIHKGEGYSYIRLSEIDPAESHLLSAWMVGQTRPLPDGIDDAVYSWDYERWQKSQKGEFVLWD